MRVGIAGVGFMGTTHAEGWAAAGAHIAGFVAETAEEAAPLAAKFGGKIYTQPANRLSTASEFNTDQRNEAFAALLKDVDVVDICTPTHLHAEMVLQAAAEGKQIVCEKPLARTTSQAREMVSACRKAGVHLLVAHVVRFFPEYALARAAVANGEIGQPALLRLHRGSYRPKKPIGNWFLDQTKSGGILLDLMIHDFDYARWVAGDVENVFAKKITTGYPDAPVDYGLAILKHKNGALSHIAGAWAYPPPIFRTSLEIFGDAGLIEFDSDSTAPILTLIKKNNPEAPDVALPSSPVSESPYTTQIKEFYLALSEGKPPRITPEDGLSAVQIAEAALKSDHTGLPVNLENLMEVLE